MLLGHHARGCGELFRPHVFGRCVDQIPRGRHGGGQCDAALGVRARGQQQLGGRTAPWFVQVELVGPQLPGHGGLLGRHHQPLVGQAVTPLRQGRRQGGQGKRMVRPGHAGEHLGQLALRIRHQGMAVGGAGKPDGLQPLAGRGRQGRRELREACGVHHGDGDGAGGDGFLELGSHGRMVTRQHWTRGNGETALVKPAFILALSTKDFFNLNL